MGNLGMGDNGGTVAEIYPLSAQCSSSGKIGKITVPQCSSSGKIKIFYSAAVLVFGKN
jgi:hypothetical protein